MNIRWNTHRVNIASASVVVVTALSLPLLSLSSAGDDLSTTPTITVSLPADADTGEGSVLLRPSAMYPCDNEDGSLPANVNACYWDASDNGGTSFILIRK